MNRFKYSSLIVLFSLPVFAHDSRLAADSEWLGHNAETPTWVDQLKAVLLNPAEAAARISIEGDYRVIRSDGQPDHATGNFPNRNNPHRINSKHKSYRVPANPVYKQQTYALGLWPFGVAINGIPFDPGAAEFWQRNPRSGWQYEALGGAVNLGVDRNNAHVQPDGTYHYHGLPTGILNQFSSVNAPALIGYAADGFPIYGPFGYREAENDQSSLVELKSSFQLKSGNRNGGPTGRYDGSFVQDYVYQKGLGDLDECNGRFGVTPDYPQGSYYYVITGQFPFIPRCFHGEPDRSFMRGGPSGIGGGMSSGRGADMGSQEMNRQRQNGPGGGPPQEAFSACQGRSEGDRVRFKTPRGHTVDGRCEKPHGNRLFAVPER